MVFWQHGSVNSTKMYLNLQLIINLTIYTYAFHTVACQKADGKTAKWKSQILTPDLG